MLPGQLPQQLARQLPAWLLLLVKVGEWESLMRLSIFPTGFTLKAAAHVLPATCKLCHHELMKIHTLLQQTAQRLWHSGVVQMLMSFLPDAHALCLADAHGLLVDIHSGI